MGIRRNKRITSTSAQIDNLGSFKYESDAGKKALAALRPELDAIGKNDVEVVRIDVTKAAYVALGVAKFVQSKEVRGRFAELPARAFDMNNADGLSAVALASLFASEQAQDAGSLDTVAKLPAPIAAEATELERRMQTVCEYNLLDDPEIAPLLEQLRPGTGYWDLLNDIKGYARIYERRADVVKLDAKNYRPGDLKRARELIAVIGEALFGAMSEQARDAYDTYARCWTMLGKRYEEVRLAGLWLFRDDPSRDERFPSLYSAARPNVGRPRKQATGEGAAALAPAAPAPDGQ